MNTNLTIKNFRVFDENGVTLELKPITILTGRNSSGKSSVVKAAMFLNAFLCQIKKAIDNNETIELEKYKVDFTKYPFNLLGNFDKIVHKGGTVKDVTMSYSIYSLRLSKDVNVEFVFSADENDELRNAYLKSLTLSTEDGVFYSSSKQSGSELNLSMLKDACYVFLLIEHHKYLKYLKDRADIYPNMPPDSISHTEYEAKAKQIVELLKIYNADSQRIQEVEKRIPDKIDNSIISRCNAQQTFHSLMEWSFKNNSLFYIPIIEELDRISKKDLKAFIETNILIKDKSASIIKASKKIIDDFVQSESDSFSSYFRNYESIYLQNLKSCRCFSLLYGRVEIYQSYLDSYYMTPKIGYYSEAEMEEDKKRWRKEWEDMPIDFDMLYDVVMTWDARRTNNNVKSDYYYLEHGFCVDYYVHRMYECLNIFASDLIKEVICPKWVGFVEYVSASRTSVRRLYPLDNEDVFTQLIKKYFEKIREIKSLEKLEESWGPFSREIYKYDLRDPKNFINRWVKEKFRLGETITLNVDNDKEGLGVLIRLIKKAGEEGGLLADEGYGITQLFSILLQIETSILSNKIDDHYYRHEPQTIFIEEPEIHLHPQYQSLLAEMFLEAYRDYNIHFIVETHSEYLVRKSQVLVANENYEDKENMEEKNPFVVYYFDGENEECPCYKMEYELSGRFSNKFGEGFFDEAGKSHLITLRKEKGLK